MEVISFVVQSGKVNLPPFKIINNSHIRFCSPSGLCLIEIFYPHHWGEWELSALGWYFDSCLKHMDLI